MRNKIFWFVLGSLLLWSCASEQSTQWIYKEQIPLGDVTPLGIAHDGNNFWVSDPDNNRLVKIDTQGKLLTTVPHLQRPMHIAFSENKLYVPEYLTDTISVFENENKSSLSVTSKLNAPAGIAVAGSTIAIVDFYNHRIILKEGKKESTVGTEGHNDGELYYPTDVEIWNNHLYVADAYNNRIQVFDFKGQYLKMIGWNDSINVATGLTVTKESIFVVDFYGNRVLVYNHKGNLKQSLNRYLNKPTDIYVKNKKMFVANYGAKNIIVYQIE